MSLNKTTSSRKETGTKQGHTHKYSPQATKQEGAPYTDMKDGHRHHIVRTKSGKVLRIEASGDPKHTHSL